LNSTRCRIFILVSSFFLASVSHSASAQETNRAPRAPRNPTTTTKGTQGRTQLPQATGTALPAWLDDAETLDAKTASLEISAGRWATVDGGETDGPAVDAAVGVNDWLQLGATVPYYRARYSDGFTASGLGDCYFGAKFQLLDPADHTIGIAAQPLLEVLSATAVSDTTLGLSRVNWGLPITFQVGNDDTSTRAYLTTGFFSRHAVFVGGAVERDLGDIFTIGGSIDFTHATRTTTGTDLAGLSPSRTDASLLVYASVSDSITLFGSLGRTISQLDQNGARFSASFGIRIETQPRTTPNTRQQTR
jgi:hypothetical protein